MNVQDFINLCDSLPLDKDDKHGEARTKLDICIKIGRASCRERV